MRSSYRFCHVSNWSPVGGTSREGLGGVALQEEVCHGGGVFEVLNAMHYFQFTLYACGS